jgi:hypothetical protein
VRGEKCAKSARATLAKQSVKLNNARRLKNADRVVDFFFIFGRAGLYFFRGVRALPRSLHAATSALFQETSRCWKTPFVDIWPHWVKRFLTTNGSNKQRRSPVHRFAQRSNYKKARGARPSISNTHRNAPCSHAPVGVRTSECRRPGTAHSAVATAQRAFVTLVTVLTFPHGVGRGRGVPRGLGVALGVAVGDTLAVAVGVAVGVTLGVGVVVAVGLGDTVAVGVTVTVAVAVAVAVGVGVGPTPTIWYSTPPE